MKAHYNDIKSIFLVITYALSCVGCSALNSVADIAQLQFNNVLGQGLEPMVTG